MLLLSSKLPDKVRKRIWRQNLLERMRSLPPNPMGGIYSEKHKEKDGGNIKRREAAEKLTSF